MQKKLLTTILATAALGGLLVLATVVPDEAGLAQAAPASGDKLDYGGDGYQIGLTCVPCGYSACDCQYYAK